MAEPSSGSAAGTGTGVSRASVISCSAAPSGAFANTSHSSFAPKNAAVCRSRTLGKKSKLKS